MWYLSSRNVVGKAVMLTMSWTGLWLVDEQVAEVLYRIKTYDATSAFSAIGMFEEVQSGHYDQIHT
ncbi:MAG: hypothetical protein GY696_06255 [Gammaproteobacteria bacterium]|nr:hypothetical protein [Gammaproteobacteria bacterium]